MNEIVQSINERKVLNFFTDEGLLPNYAFPEARRRVEVSHLSTEPKDRRRRCKYKTQTYEYERPRRPPQFQSWHPQISSMPKDVNSK